MSPQVFGIIMFIVVLGFILFVWAVLFRYWLGDKAKGRVERQWTSRVCKSSMAMAGV
jgi:hypothetical protein